MTFHALRRVVRVTLRSFSINFPGPVQNALVKKLTEKFSPCFLDIECESHLHHVEKGAEKHFKIQIVSDQFEGLSRLQMHRLVNDCLAEELADHVHAIRLDPHAPSKFKGKAFPFTSPCRGKATSTLQKTVSAWPT